MGGFPLAFLPRCRALSLLDFEALLELPDTLFSPTVSLSFLVTVQMAVILSKAFSLILLYALSSMLLLVNASFHAGLSRHETNSDRLRRGLPPLAPRMLYEPTRVNGLGELS